MHGSHEGGPERRAHLTREIMTKTGIDEAMLERLVRSFYQRLQSNPLLSPIFVERIADWGAHISKLCDFWSSVVLMSGRYHGQPMQAHLNLPIDSKHFDCGLAMFEQTASELCPPTAAAHFVTGRHVR
jgi:hemoglobin